MALKLLLVAVFACLAVLQPAAAEQAPSPPTVLILNSYNKGLPWTDEQTDGIISVLRDSGADPIFYVEYIDWKNNPTPENLRLTYELLKTKYAHKKIDIVMATDDMAVIFTLQHRRELFSDAPLVFSGVYPAAAETMMAYEPDVTGVYEVPDVAGTMKLMASLNPNLKYIYLLFDNTESGAVTWVPVEMAAPRIKENLSVVSLNYLTRDQIAVTLGSLPDDSAVLVSTYSRDAADYVMEVERYVKFFAENSRAPVYILYDFETGYGAVGGSVLSGRRQGQAAAALANRILAGERASAIKPVDPQDSSTVVDYRQLAKYNLPPERVPDGAVFVNKPQTLYEQHGQVIAAAATVIGAMAAYILVLISSIRRRRTAEENLRTSNEELGSLYEEILASQEELQAQYESLEAAKQALAESEERYKLSLAGANDGLWDWDFVTNEVYLSERCTELVGVERQRVSGLDGFLAKSVPAGERRKVLAALRRHLQGKTPHFSYEHRIHTPGGVKWIVTRGKALMDEAGRPVRMAGSITDISERKAKDDLVRHMAYHDALTGIANRAALNRELKALVAGIKGDQGGALLFIDLDNFKGINDTFGHSYGDKLLVVVSQRLRSIDDDRHFVARVGGDEFIVLLEGAGRSQAAEYADRLLAVFANPLSVNGKSVYVTVSIGLTIFPDDGTSAEELFKNADMAMYKAKDLGKSRYAFFDRGMDELVRQKTQIEHDLREAIPNGELRLWYQPYVETATGRVCGLEALIRWQRPDRMVMPGEFIKVAEETGLIVPIGDWVLRSACSFAAALRRQGAGQPVVSVNLSVVQLIRGDFVRWVREVVDETGADPRAIAFEITESVLMDNFEANIDKLAEVRRLGVRIYLDDFGTGYSSLKYLRQLPVDIIKIDKSFVDDLDDADGQREIIGSIINLAHRARQQVVAEGVETGRQLEKLIKFKCDFVQGYYYSRPVAERDVPDLLQRLGQREGK
ncbi:MAG: ABC transporter substrate binding protein [Sporomusaceae bacterium]|nr:ABC transporter substrate binding protein [Sporomusaceae bacterium]